MKKMETFYVKISIRSSKHNKSGDAWLLIRASSADSAKSKFVRYHNRKARGMYSHAPQVLKKELINSSDLTLRKDPPSRSSIYDLEHDKWVYVDRNLNQSKPPAKRKNTRTAKPSKLCDRQFELLVKKSQELKKPVVYLTDLLKHDKAILRRKSPKQFIWTVWETGTSIAVLDNAGKAHSPDSYRGFYARFGLDGMGGSSAYQHFLVSNTTMKSISAKEAQAAIKRVFLKHYPRMNIYEKYH